MRTGSGGPGQLDDVELGAGRAGVLEEGAHYLEAASLHRDHLSQPLEAARCLERGGVYHQAIEIYEQHSWF